MKRELDRRVAAGLEVVLYWHGADTVTVFVHDATTGVELELAVEATHALDAFHHPYAYAVGSSVSHAPWPAAA